MKLIIYCFLGLCLFSGEINSAPTYHRGIEVVLNTVFGQVSSLYKQIQLVILQLSNIAEAGIRQLEEDFIKAAINISDLVNDFGENAKVCIKKYWKTLEAAKNEVKTNIQECAKNIKRQGSTITDSLQKQQKYVETSSSQFYDAINDCLEFSSGKLAECIFYKMNELKNIASGVSASTEETLKKAVEQTSNLSKQGNECIRSALMRFGKVQKEVSTKIRECVKDSWSDYY